MEKEIKIEELESVNIGNIFANTVHIKNIWRHDGRNTPYKDESGRASHTMHDVDINLNKKITRHYFEDGTIADYEIGEMIVDGSKYPAVDITSVTGTPEELFVVALFGED